MGVDLTTIAQKKNADGKYEDIDGEFSDGSCFGWRDYGIYGFLANTNNWSAIPPISDCRGSPDDWLVNKTHPWEDYGPSSWLTVKELAEYDYDQIVEDRRVTVQTGPNSWSGGHTCDPGKGVSMPLREFLGEHFFNDLEELKRIKADRILLFFSY